MIYVIFLGLTDTILVSQGRKNMLFERRKTELNYFHHCVKNVRIGSLVGPFFPALN